MLESAVPEALELRVELMQEKRTLVIVRQRLVGTRYHAAGVLRSEGKQT